jgi:hypothetical protein
VTVWRMISLTLEADRLQVGRGNQIMMSFWNKKRDFEIQNQDLMGYIKCDKKRSMKRKNWNY